MRKVGRDDPQRSIHRLDARRGSRESRQDPCLALRGVGSPHKTGYGELTVRYKVGEDMAADIPRGPSHDDMPDWLLLSWRADGHAPERVQIANESIIRTGLRGIYAMCGLSS